MQPLTQDQERTLRRWASTVGTRPRKVDKAFLEADKGITEEQIDGWWRGVEKENGDCADRGFVSPIRDVVRGSNGSSGLIPGSIISRQGSLQDNLIANLQFGEMHGGFQDLEHAFEPGAQYWPSIGTEQGGIDDSVAMQQETHPWLPVGYSQNGVRSPASSLLEPIPFLSEPFSNWRHLSTLDRSSSLSYGSSQRTWDTASTLVSFCDPYSEGHLQQDFGLPKENSMNSAQLSLKTLSAGSMFPSQTVPENDAACTSTILDSPLISGVHRRCPSKECHNSTRNADASITGPAVPLKPEKCKVRYTCTTCQRGFSRKGDWERHEESQHDPQRYWTCMYGDPAIQTGTSWICAFCETRKPDRNEIVGHLMRRHKINTCANKLPQNRTFTRKDKLKQHLQQVHALSESSVRWEAWYQAARKKWAWGCGFCGACSFTWEGRLIHIAEHYERQNLDISQWSHSLVIKGLLKQFQNFNVSTAWKEQVGWAPNSDHLLEWSESDAAKLKRKLEFHEGTPQELAGEARRSAVNSCAGYDASGWTPSDSRVTTLTSPILFLDPRGKSWPETVASGNAQISTFSISLDAGHVEDVDGLPDYI